MNMPLLNCPGHNYGGGLTAEGCGKVQAVYAVRKIGISPGIKDTRPILVCPHCGTRLLPTPLEIAQTRGVVV